MKRTPSDSGGLYAIKHPTPEVVLIPPPQYEEGQKPAPQDLVSSQIGPHEAALIKRLMDDPSTNFIVKVKPDRGGSRQDLAEDLPVGMFENQAIMQQLQKRQASSEDYVETQPLIGGGNLVLGPAQSQYKSSSNLPMLLTKNGGSVLISEMKNVRNLMQKYQLNTSGTNSDLPSTRTNNSSRASPKQAFSTHQGSQRSKAYSFKNIQMLKKPVKQLQILPSTQPKKKQQGDDLGLELNPITQSTTSTSRLPIPLTQQDESGGWSDPDDEYNHHLYSKQFNLAQKAQHNKKGQKLVRSQRPQTKQPGSPIQAKDEYHKYLYKVLQTPREVPEVQQIVQPKYNKALKDYIEHMDTKRTSRLTDQLLNQDPAVNIQSTLEVYNLNSSSSLRTLNCPAGNLPNSNPSDVSQLSNMIPEIMLTTIDQSEKRVTLPQIRVTKIQGSAQSEEMTLKTDEKQQGVSSRVRLRSNDDLKAKITSYLREKRIKEKDQQKSLQSLKEPLVTGISLGESRSQSILQSQSKNKTQLKYPQHFNPMSINQLTAVQSHQNLKVDPLITISNTIQPHRDRVHTKQVLKPQQHSTGAKSPQPLIKENFRVQGGSLMAKPNARSMRTLEPIAHYSSQEDSSPSKTALNTVTFPSKEQNEMVVEIKVHQPAKEKRVIMKTRKQLKNAQQWPNEVSIISNSDRVCEQQSILTVGKTLNQHFSDRIIRMGGRFLSVRQKVTTGTGTDTTGLAVDTTKLEAHIQELEEILRQEQSKNKECSTSMDMDDLIRLNTSQLMPLKMIDQQNFRDKFLVQIHNKKERNNQNSSSLNSQRVTGKEYNKDLEQYFNVNTRQVIRLGQRNLCDSTLRTLQATQDLRDKPPKLSSQLIPPPPET